MAGNPAFAVAVKAIYDCLKHPKEAGGLQELNPREATPDLLRLVNRTDEFIQLQEKYFRS